MNKLIRGVILSLGVVLGVPPLSAEEAPPETTSFWGSLRQKIETMTPKKKLAVTTAVGGVRGALVEADDLYWKGRSEGDETPGVELEDFNNALVLFESGNAEGAQNAFNKFVDEYPESRLLSDARQALELLQQQ